MLGELLTYQVQEHELNLCEHEYTELEQQHRKQAHTTELLQGYTCALNYLADDEQGNVLHWLSKVEHHLTQIQRFDPSVQANTELLGQALIHLQEVGHDLQTRSKVLSLTRKILRK